MERLFISVLNMSFTAGIAILAVLILRLMLKKAPKIFSYALWAAVLFRLLCPFSFSSAVSLLGFIGAAHAPNVEQGRIEYIPENIGLMEQPAVHLPLSSAQNADGAPVPAADIGNAGAFAKPMKLMALIGAYIWPAGIVIMLLYGVIAYLRLRRRLKPAVHEMKNIFRSPDISTPFVCGIISPRIYLPSTLEDEEKRYIILHELIHIRRGDHILRIISFFALCLHWFNPLVWLAFFTSGKDMEMSCDEAVIRKIGSGVKKEYSASLLSLASGRRIVPGIPLAFGKGETGSRIKNILKYKKPAKIAAGAIAAVCIAAVIALAANPGRKGAESGGTASNGDEAAEVFYGVVSDVDVLGTDRMLITIPGLGDVEIPEAAEVYPFIEIEEFSGLEAGYLVEITFPEGVEVSIQETYPSAFSVPAESIVVKGEGFSLRPADSGRYLFTVPWGIAREAEAGDTLTIYYFDVEAGYYYDKGEGGEDGREKTLLASAEVLSVDMENYDVWVELSAEEVRTFLAMFGHGITCDVMQTENQGGLQTADGQNAENSRNTPPAGGTAVLTVGQQDGNAGNGQNAESGWYVFPATGDIAGLTSEHLARGAIVDGIYRVYVRSISRSARGIDRYIVDDLEDRELLFLAFADDCRFYTNTETDTLSYAEVPFDEFADFAEDVFSYLNPPMLLTFEDDVITEAILENYYGNGISFDAVYPDTWYGHIQDITSLDGTDVLNEYYTLESAQEADIGDGVGYEQILVYTGNIGDGDSGIVLFNNSEYELLYTLSAHVSRAGWNNIYLGGRNGIGFIMTVHIENRGDYGNYAYHVFRLSKDGEVRLIAGSSFDWEDGRIPYDDELFREWAGEMSGYLADSYLILSTQEGELRTEHVSEADRYNYETLRRGR